MTVQQFGRTTALTDADERQAIASGYLWYDYFAIPQPTASTCQDVKEEDFTKAVDSIPAYIQRCTHFVILSPCLMHDDLQDQYCSKSTWNRRGWCRAELSCWALSENKSRNTRMITILHAAKVVEANPLQWLFSTPRTGDFTCERDRDVVGELLHRILQARLRTEEDSFMYRFLKAVGAHILGTESPESDCGIWLQHFRFASAGDTGKYGFGPLHIAAIQGNVPVLHELMRNGLHVDARTTHEVRQVLAPERMTPLMAAALYIPIPETNRSVCEALVQLQADVSAKSASGRQPLHFAAVNSGGADTIDLLLDAKGGAHVDARDKAGETALFAACEATSSCTLSSSITENIRRLCAHGADPAICNRAGYFPLYRIAAGALEDVQVLLSAKADANQQVQRTVANTVTSTLLPILATLKQFDVGTALLAKHAVAATALHSHSLANNLPTVRLLLEAGADPSISNATGFSPRGLIMEVYNMAGPMEELLLRAELVGHGINASPHASESCTRRC